MSLADLSLPAARSQDWTSLYANSLTANELKTDNSNIGGTNVSAVTPSSIAVIDGTNSSTMTSTSLSVTSITVTDGTNASTVTPTTIAVTDGTNTSTLTKLGLRIVPQPRASYEGPVATTLTDGAQQDIKWSTVGSALGAAVGISVDNAQPTTFTIQRAGTYMVSLTVVLNQPLINDSVIEFGIDGTYQSALLGWCGSGTVGGVATTGMAPAFLSGSCIKTYSVGDTIKMYGLWVKNADTQANYPLSTNLDNVVYIYMLSHTN